jgi:hypothetical protein
MKIWMLGNTFLKWLSLGVFLCFFTFPVSSNPYSSLESELFIEHFIQEVHSKEVSIPFTENVSSSVFGEAGFSDVLTEPSEMVEQHFFLEIASKTVSIFSLLEKPNLPYTGLHIPVHVSFFPASTAVLNGKGFNPLLAPYKNRSVYPIFIGTSLNKNIFIFYHITKKEQRALALKNTSPPEEKQKGALSC